MLCWLVHISYWTRRFHDISQFMEIYLSFGNLKPKHMLVTQFDRRIPLDMATSSSPYTQHYHILTNILGTRSFILAGELFILNNSKKSLTILWLYMKHRLTHKLGF